MSTPIQNLKVLLLLQLGIGAGITLLVALFADLRLAASFGIGVVVMGLNLGLLAWTWWRVFTKKSIAWTVLVIVIKYAVLLGTLFYLARTHWFSALGAGLGITSFVLAALGLAFFIKDEDSNTKRENDLGSSSL